MKTAILAAAAASLALAGSAFAQSDMSAAGDPTSASGYVMAAGQSDLFEIQEGRLAERMGATARVRAFGRQMVTAHTKSTRMVVAAAKASGMDPSPPMLSPDQQQMMQQLQGTSGAAFDAMYVHQQMQSHQQALQVQQGYAQNGDNPRLKAAAAKIVPVVQHHISELQAMGGGSASM